MSEERKMIIKELNIGIKRVLLLALAVIICILLNIIAKGKLFQFSNIGIIACHAVFPSLVAWCMMFIYSTGNIDLSMGASMLLAGTLGIGTIEQLRLGYVGMIMVSVICAVLFQVLNLCISTFGKLPTWIAGLGMTMIYESIFSIYVSERSKTLGTATVLIPKNYAFFGTTQGMFVLWAVGLVFAYLLFSKSPLGMNIRSVGGNSKVAEALGIKKLRTVFWTAIVGGILLGLSSVAYISYSSMLYAKSGLTSITIIFRALAAYLLADCISGLIELPIAIFFSAFAVEVLFSFMAMVGVEAGTGQNIGLGLVVILCGVLAALGKKKGVVK